MGGLSDEEYGEEGHSTTSEENNEDQNFHTIQCGFRR
jgi:hypothetical protein